MIFFPKRFLLICFIFLSVYGCSESEVDFNEINESRIEKSMSSGAFKQVDAIEFLQQGGLYVDDPAFDDSPIDKPLVLPLLKTLEGDFGFEWIALVNPDQKQGRAYDIVAKIPVGVSRTRVEKRLKELQQEFPGDILQSWGEEWFSIDFFNSEEADFLNEDLES